MEASKYIDTTHSTHCDTIKPTQHYSVCGMWWVVCVVDTCFTQELLAAAVLLVSLFFFLLLLFSFSFFLFSFAQLSLSKCSQWVFGSHPSQYTPQTGQVCGGEF